MADDPGISKDPFEDILRHLDEEALFEESHLGSQDEQGLERGRVQASEEFDHLLDDDFWLNVPKPGDQTALTPQLRQKVEASQAHQAEDASARREAEEVAALRRAAVAAGKRGIEETGDEKLQNAPKRVRVVESPERSPIETTDPGIFHHVRGTPFVAIVNTSIGEPVPPSPDLDPATLDLVPWDELDEVVELDATLWDMFDTTEGVPAPPSHHDGAPVTKVAGAEENILRSVGIDLPPQRPPVGEDEEIQEAIRRSLQENYAGGRPDSRSSTSSPDHDGAGPSRHPGSPGSPGSPAPSSRPPDSPGSGKQPESPAPSSRPPDSPGSARQPDSPAPSSQPPDCPGSASRHAGSPGPSNERQQHPADRLRIVSDEFLQRAREQPLTLLNAARAQMVDGAEIAEPEGPHATDPRMRRAEVSINLRQNFLEELKWDFVNCMWQEARGNEPKALMLADLNFLVRMYERSLLGQPSHVRRACDRGADPLQCCWSHYFRDVLAVTGDEKRWDLFILMFCRDLVRQLLIHMDAQKHPTIHGVKRYPKFVINILENWIRAHIDKPLATPADLQDLERLTGVDRIRIAGYVADFRKRTRRGRARQEGRDPDVPEGINEMHMAVQGALLKVAYTRRTSAGTISAADCRTVAARLGASYTADQVRDWMAAFRARNKEILKRKPATSVSRPELYQAVRETMQGLPTPQQLEKWRNDYDATQEDQETWEAIVDDDDAAAADPRGDDDDEGEVQREDDSFPPELMDTGVEPFAGTNIPDSTFSSAIEVDARPLSNSRSKSPPTSQSQSEAPHALTKAEGSGAASDQSSGQLDGTSGTEEASGSGAQRPQAESGMEIQRTPQGSLNRRRAQARQRAQAPAGRGGGGGEPGSPSNSPPSSPDAEETHMEEGWYVRLRNDFLNDARGAIARQADTGPASPDWPDPVAMKVLAQGANDPYNTARWSSVIRMVNVNPLRIQPETARKLTANCQFFVDVYRFATQEACVEYVVCRVSAQAGCTFVADKISALDTTCVHGAMQYSMNRLMGATQHCRLECASSNRDPTSCCWRTKFMRVDQEGEASIQAELTMNMFRADIVYAITVALRTDPNWGQNYIQVQRYPKFCRRILQQWANEHPGNPNPTRAEKNHLADTTGMLVEAIERWFRSYRGGLPAPAAGTPGHRAPRHKFTETQRNILKEFIVLHGPHPTNLQIRQVAELSGVPVNAVINFNKRYREQNPTMWPDQRHEARGPGRGRGRGQPPPDP